MVTRDLSLQEPLASDVTATVIHLAELSQRAASTSSEALSIVANEMLERLLVLFAAQRGAVLLSMQVHIPSEQPSLPAPTNPKFLRTLAVYGMREEEVHALLPGFPPANAEYLASEAAPDLSCWITFRLPIGNFIAESRRLQGSSLPELSSSRSRQPLQALLVLGWDGQEDGTCVSAVERGHTLLPFIADAAGAVIVSILQAEHVHELESASVQKALDEMELLKAELLATVSHELRSPLASVKGYTATLLRHEHRLSRGERHQFLLAISEASNRLELIIERLLEISQLETDAIIIERLPIDIARLAQEALIAAEEGASAYSPDRFIFNLRLEDTDGNPATNAPLILADPRRLREVLDNLLENAMKYSPEGGTINIVLRPTMQSYTNSAKARMRYHHKHTSRAHDLSSRHLNRGMLEIRISDSGMGIPGEHLERIFERFHRVDMRLTREVNGLGLGLAICKRIVELHDGMIWAESSPNGGSTFHVLLPIDNRGE